MDPLNTWFGRYPFYGVLATLLLGSIWGDFWAYIRKLPFGLPSAARSYHIARLARLDQAISDPSFLYKHILAQVAMWVLFCGAQGIWIANRFSPTHLSWNTPDDLIFDLALRQASLNYLAWHTVAYCACAIGLTVLFDLWMFRNPVEQANNIRVKIIDLPVVEGDAE